MGQELWQKEEEKEQCQEYDEVFFQLKYFAERYLDKFDDVQCHGNVIELETHIEYIQEHCVYQTCLGEGSKVSRG